MSVQMPSRGQPIDYIYLSNVAQSINYLESKIAEKSKISIGATQQDQETLKVKFETAKVDVTNPSEALNLNGVEVSHNFKSGFKYAPTVSLAVQYTGNAAVKPDDINVIITSISESSVKMKVSFNVKTKATVTVHITAIGIPA
jgi:hypothetical protein